MPNNSYCLVGVMSGTSLDGLDMVLCNFIESDSGWKFAIQKSVTVPYSKAWVERLENAWQLSGKELTKLDRAYGSLIGELVKENILNEPNSSILISSHGHTVFHSPAEGYTLQIGHGPSIAVKTGVPVVYDFRSADIEKGGQGAPLVPVGDELLFNQYDACLNLGGFSNISFNKQEQRVAMDICPVNFILNYFAKLLGKPFDKDGELGKQGKVNSDLLKELNGIVYYMQEPPKSLAREWVEEYMYPIIAEYPLSEKDILATLYEHISLQITRVIQNAGICNVLLTGGGALNKFLVSKLRQNKGFEIEIPDKVIIDYKEAVIFGFLGLLRYLERENCYASVTGASSNSICGVLAYP